MQTRKIDGLARILDALHHYWFVKGVITDKMMSTALFKLEHRKNPFLEENFMQELRKNAAKIDYNLAHRAFKVKLEGDK